MSSPTIVLLPGLEGTGKLFVDLVSEFPPSLPLIVGKYPTHRFLSYSELVPYVKEIAPSESRFVLVAESFSTSLAIMFAATRPPNLVGMILCAGFIANPAGNWTLLARMLARRAVFRISPPGWFLRHFLIGKNPPAHVEASFRGSLRAVDADVLAARLRAALNCDARRDLGQTKIPLMYVQAECDRLISAQCFREVQRVRPDVELVSIPGAPHLVLQREPQKCAEIIAQFVAEFAT